MNLILNYVEVYEEIRYLNNTLPAAGCLLLPHFQNEMLMNEEIAQANVCVWERSHRGASIPHAAVETTGSCAAAAAAERNVCIAFIHSLVPFRSNAFSMHSNESRKKAKTFE